jgi:hypothetical protein
MAFTKKQREEFEAAIESLLATVKGKEATMYTTLRDLFVDVLGYPKTSVVVDKAALSILPTTTIRSAA